MHPALFVTGFVTVGLLFALQDWINMRTMSSHRFSLGLIASAWGVQFFLLGIFCWILWAWLGPRIQQASLSWMLTRMLPLSIIVSIVEEMIWVACFPQLPLTHPHMPFFKRVVFQLDAELIDSMLIFWFAFLLFRGVGYYQKYREKETIAAKLAVQLANAQIRALRMQLNPHFLFNTMNSISSLMQVNVPAADRMLEQLSSLLRITLERGDVQLIAISDEMEFLEMYLALQDGRFAGRVRQEVHVDPSLYDALIPAMILQPVVENAYAHGLSRLDTGGLLSIDVSRKRNRLNISITNNGIGLNPAPRRDSTGSGIGLTNVKNRLRLHYNADQSFSIADAGTNKVRVTITLPCNSHQVQPKPSQDMVCDDPCSHSRR